MEQVARNPGLQKAIEAIGGISELARRLGLQRQAVSQWTQVPAGRMLMVQALTGIPLCELRPDLWPAPALETGSNSGAEVAEGEAGK